MGIFLSDSQTTAIFQSLDAAYAILARAQGEADRYEAKREEFKILTFPSPSVREEQSEKSTFLKFTKKELSKMPKWFEKEIQKKGGKYPNTRIKPNGSIEMRCRRNGLNISVCAKSMTEVKRLFLEALANANGTTTVETKLKDFAIQWLDVVKRREVKESTLKSYFYKLNRLIIPALGERYMSSIKPFDIQRLMNDLSDRGLERSEVEVYDLLKALFNFAEAQGAIEKNPMKPIRKPRHQKKHGKAFTIEEERELIDKCITGNFRCRYAFILLVFTGIRRSELKTIEISDSWITVTTAKTRKGEPELKRRIPVSPMLKPYLPLMIAENLNVTEEYMTRWLPKIMPGHHLHELRHTFITRCQECGISRELTSVWAGHRADDSITSNVYTHFSESYQLNEAKKLLY